MGWPPVRQFRKNSLASTSKTNEEVDGKASTGASFVKVSMDGAPYLRKVDLRNYSAYQGLSSALEKMFSCFTIGELHGYSRCLFISSIFSFSEVKVQNFHCVMQVSMVPMELQGGRC